jgi:succinate-semialdehyde dehydrogenase/glutarate-semialdehyde dehydrogenase
VTSRADLHAPQPNGRPTADTRTVAAAIDNALIARLVDRVAAGPDAPRVTTSAPFTGAAIAELPQTSPGKVSGVVARARHVQPAWAARAPGERAAVLRRLYDRVIARQRQALDLMQIEAGKARAHAFEEIVDIAITASWHARRGPRLLADRRRKGLLPGLTVATEVCHPRGVVGVIAPWNFPLSLALAEALPALLAGNAVVLKPDTQAALTALWAAEQLEQAGLPENVLQIVVGDGPVIGPALLAEVDFVCFTGSTPVGRTVAQQAASRLVGASLELGGKNGLYVAADADVGRAAAAAVRDCFTSAGQVCISMERLVLHRDIAAAFLDRFVALTERLRMGPALDWSTDLGCLVSRTQLEHVRSHVDDAVARGASVLTGGVPRADVGPLFYAPTVLDGVPREAACYAQETFGPVVAVSRVASDADAVGLINDTDYGLNASVWSRDLARARQIARSIKTRTVTINEAYTASWSAMSSPMGGRGQSGLGRRHGAQGLLRFTESQTIAEARFGSEFLYALGGRRMAATITRALRSARRARLPWP